MMTPFVTVQTVLAFFGAGTVTAAQQMLCCGCRRHVKGLDTVEETCEGVLDTVAVEEAQAFERANVEPYFIHREGVGTGGRVGRFDGRFRPERGREVRLYAVVTGAYGRPAGGGGGGH